MRQRCVTSAAGESDVQLPKGHRPNVGEPREWLRAPLVTTTRPDLLRLIVQQ